MENNCDCRCHTSVEANKSYGGWYCRKCADNHKSEKLIVEEMLDVFESYYPEPVIHTHKGNLTRMNAAYQKSQKQKLEKDKWGRDEVYYAEFGNSVGARGRCLFSNLDAAIFYVVSELGNDIDWKKFPDPSKEYPYEDRNGKNHRLNPIFIVNQITINSKLVYGKVEKMTIANNWIVGNGIAFAAREQFFRATGRDIVEIAGDGAHLQGKVGNL